MMEKGLVSYPLSMSSCHLMPEEKAPGGRVLDSSLSASVALKAMKKEIRNALFNTVLEERQETCKTTSLNLDLNSCI